jgi:hypothetical protein
MIKKLTAEFDKDITLFKFDDKIDELVEIFPKGKSVLIKVDTSEGKSVATLEVNPDQNALQRKVWLVNT